MKTQHFLNVFLLIAASNELFMMIWLQVLSLLWPYWDSWKWILCNAKTTEEQASSTDIHQAILACLWRILTCTILWTFRINHFLSIGLDLWNYNSFQNLQHLYRVMLFCLWCVLKINVLRSWIDRFLKTNLWFLYCSMHRWHKWSE